MLDKDKQYQERLMYESEKGLEQLRTGKTDDPLAAAAGGGWGLKEPPLGWKQIKDPKK